MRGNADLFATWHVLAAEIPSNDSPVLSQADWALVVAGGHPAVPVLRIEGHVTAERAPRLRAAILAVLAGLPPELRRSVEIDHDAATSQLAAYAGFLRTLRQALPAGAQLSATALPTWLGSPDFAPFADSVDRLVLQLHSVDDPRLGLFRPARALDWTRALARRTRTPFLVALPAYGARISDGAGGLRVTSESALLDGEAGAEIAADPADVADFLERLRQDPPDTLQGIAWFRLPVDGDRRAWAAATLRAVLAGGELARTTIATRPGDAPGVREILVANAGETDGALPRGIVLPTGCLAADGLGQYVIDGGRLVLRGAGGGLLPPHSASLAGWMRCADAGLHAEEGD